MSSFFLLYLYYSSIWQTSINLLFILLWNTIIFYYFYYTINFFSYVMHMHWLIHFECWLLIAIKSDVITCNSVLVNLLIKFWLQRVEWSLSIKSLTSFPQPSLLGNFYIISATHSYNWWWLSDNLKNRWCTFFSKKLPKNSQST